MDILNKTYKKWQDFKKKNKLLSVIIFLFFIGILLYLIKWLLPDENLQVIFSFFAAWSMLTLKHNLEKEVKKHHYNLEKNYELIEEVLNKAHEFLRLELTGKKPGLNTDFHQEEINYVSKLINILFELDVLLSSKLIIYAPRKILFAFYKVVAEISDFDKSLSIRRDNLEKFSFSCRKELAKLADMKYEEVSENLKNSKFKSMIDDRVKKLKSTEIR